VVTIENLWSDEAIHFEYRKKGRYDYVADGLYVWYSRLRADGRPHDIPSLKPVDADDEPPSDRSMFTMRAVDRCTWDPLNDESRGKGRALDMGEYVMAWQTGGITTFRLSLHRRADGSANYEISWDSGFNSRRVCNSAGRP
jgi:hypothetical protein